jgi:hypothetical protein
MKVRLRTPLRRGKGVGVGGSGDKNPVQVRLGEAGGPQLRGQVGEEISEPGRPPVAGPITRRAASMPSMI